jgi:hypothetical protein
MCLGKTLDHFLTFGEQGIQDGAKLVMTVRKNKPPLAQLEAARAKLGIKTLPVEIKPMLNQQPIQS